MKKIEVYEVNGKMFRSATDAAHEELLMVLCPDATPGDTVQAMARCLLDKRDEIMRVFERLAYEVAPEIQPELFS